MTRTQAALAAASFVAFAGARVANAGSNAKQIEAVCAHLAQTQSALDAFDGLTSDSSVTQAQAMAARVAEEVEQLGESAAKVRPKQYEELKAAADQLDEAMNDARPAATLGEVRSSIQSSRQRVGEAYRGLQQSVRCP